MALKRSIGNWVAPPRFILFFALLVVGGFAAQAWLPTTLAIMAAFDLAAVVFVASHAPLFNDEADQMRRGARDNDAHRLVLLFLTLVMSIVILVAVAGELTGGKQLTTLETGLVVSTLLIAWVFANFVYALHYAHLYYSGAEKGGDHGGLDFPGKRPEPDYWDFVYFSFTLGVALQTSDVCITSTRIRRLVTLHCVEAFIYNLGVLALAVNVLAR